VCGRARGGRRAREGGRAQGIVSGVVGASKCCDGRHLLCGLMRVCREMGEKWKSTPTHAFVGVVDGAGAVVVPESMST
jgi:hypothetical protein